MVFHQFSFFFHFFITFVLFFGHFSKDINVHFVTWVWNKCLPLIADQGWMRKSYAAILAVNEDNRKKRNEWRCWPSYLWISNFFISELRLMADILDKIVSKCFLIGKKRNLNKELKRDCRIIERKEKRKLVVWVLWHINLCRLFNAKSIFIQIINSISNNSI